MMTIRTLVHTMTAVMTTLALTAAAGEASTPVSMHPQRRVTLKLLPGDAAAAVAGQLAATYRGTLLEPVDGTASTFDMAVSDSAADRLRMDPRVARIEQLDTPNEVAASPLTLGPYSYDGSGNITQIGSDTFVYDGLHRLESGTADGKRQNYTYDAFGNILTVTTEGNVATKLTLGVNVANNRLSEAGAPNNVFGGYDDAGNMTNYLGVDTFEYDGVGMVKESTVEGVHRAYLYSAADERLATLYPAGNAVPTSEWTLRDAGGAVLRRFTKQGTVWRWDQDYIYRDGALLAADTPGDTQHFHLDHLGTPRLITSKGGVEVARHTYYPFGQEATPSTDPERRRFTGHERDSANLDYMHARYYLPYAGRFLSVDPAIESVHLSMPQTWNRYSYGLNNPLKYIDPTGEAVFLVTYTTGNEEGDAQFKKAAETRAAEIRKQEGFDPAKDTVLLRGVATKADFAGAVKEANSMASTFGQVRSVETFSHAGPLDGPVFPGNSPRDNQFKAAELKDLKINWEAGGSGRFYGCTTANFAQTFANAQGVSAYGYAGYANFSYNPNYWVFSPNPHKGPLYLIQAGGWSNGRLRGAVGKWTGYTQAVPMVRKNPKP